MANIKDVLGSLVDNLDSTIDLGTSRNRNTVTVENARAAALMLEVQNKEMQMRREEDRNDKMLKTATSILQVLLFLGAFGFVAWLILYVKKNQ